MTELFYMRGNLGLFCYAPFAVGAMLGDEKEAFDYGGTVFCRIADTEELECPQHISEVGDVVEILLSLCWSRKAASALDGIRWSPTMRVRNIEVRNSKDQVLDVFQWASDFGYYDVLDREHSRYEVVKGTNAIVHVEHAAVDANRFPPCDNCGYFYGCGFFVAREVKNRLEQAGVAGFSFRPVEVLSG